MQQQKVLEHSAIMLYIPPRVFLSIVPDNMGRVIQYHTLDDSKQGYCIVYNACWLSLGHLQLKRHPEHTLMSVIAQTYNNPITFSSHFEYNLLSLGRHEHG